MRSYKFAGYGEAVSEVVGESPAPQGSEVLLNVEACGVCHSDLHVLDGFFELGDGKRLDLSGGRNLPFTLGHEIAGSVAALGPDATGPTPGERVVVYPWIGCGECAICGAGDEHLCADARALGIQVDGGYADQVLVPHPRYLLDFGDIPARLAATYACSGLTAYSALKRIETMAAVADRILAAPFAVVGSIGVLAELPNFHRLLERSGVDFELHTAGEYKRTLTLFGENTDAARDKILEVRELVAELDYAVRQVQIESRIVIAQSDFVHELGVRFGVTALHLGSNIGILAADGSAADIINPAINPRDDGLLDIPGYPDRYQVNLPANDPNASTLGLSFLGSDVILDLELSALEADGEGEVISTPRVITANQAEAFIQQGVEIPYQQASSSGATNVQFKEAVLELKVVPLITPDQRIQMDLEVRQDTVGEIFTGALGAEIPSIDTRELQTTVLVGNGDTVVLGGIFQDENNSREEKVPWLGDIPALGALFRRRSNEGKKRELVIFVTPTIIEDTTSM